MKAPAQTTAPGTAPGRFRVPTKVGCEEVFEDLAPRLRAKARRTALALGVDPREAWADAQLYFVEAYILHYRDCSEFAQRAMFSVWARIRREARAEIRRRKRLRRHLGVDPDRLPAAEDRPEPALCADAKALTDLVLDPPPDSPLAAARAAGAPAPRLRKLARAHARDAWGWDRERLEDAWESVAEAFAF